MGNDGIDKIADPNLSLSDESADVGENGRHIDSRSSLKHPFKIIISGR